MNVQQILKPLMLAAVAFCAFAGQAPRALVAFLTVIGARIHFGGESRPRLALFGEGRARSRGRG